MPEHPEAPELDEVTVVAIDQGSGPEDAPASPVTRFAGSSPPAGGTEAGVTWPAKATSSRPLGPMGCPVMCSSTVMAWGPLGRRSDHSR